jgi:hypothetical protein
VRARASTSFSAPIAGGGATSAEDSLRPVKAHIGALDAFDQHLDGAVRQLEQLQHLGQRAGLVDGVDGRIVVGRVLLGDQQNPLVVAHHVFQRLDRLVAADEQRHDHVRKDDDVAQRQDGKRLETAFAYGSFGGFRHSCSFHRAGPESPHHTHKRTGTQPDPVT